MSFRAWQTRTDSGSAPAQWTMPPDRTWLWFLAILIANYLLVRLLLPGPEGPLTVPYTLFEEEVRRGNVDAIYSRGETITGRFEAPVTYPPADQKREEKEQNTMAAARRAEPKTANNFTTTLPAFVDPGLETFLIENNVEISAEPIEEGGSPWATFLFGFGPALLLILFYVWIFRRAAQ